MTNPIETKSNRAHRISRRRVLAGGGAGLALALGASCSLGDEGEKEPKALERGDRVEIEDTPEEIIQKAYELGYQYEKDHGGCARCTLAACQDAIPFVPVDVSLFRGST
jgi:hypothetical protein